MMIMIIIITIIMIRPKPICTMYYHYLRIKFAFRERKHYANTSNDDSIWVQNQKQSDDLKNSNYKYIRI